MKFPGFVDGAYTLPSFKVECQDCTNLYYEQTETGMQPYGEATLVSTPGLKLFATAPGKTVWRCLYLASNGNLYGVCGNKIYRISDMGVVTELTASGTAVTLNSSSGVVTMADNGTYVLLCHSTDQLTSSVYSIALATDVVAAVNVEGIDVYKVFSLGFKTGRFLLAGFYGAGGISQAGGRVHYSGLNTITFAALDFFAAQASPDKINQILTAMDYVWLGGEQTIEVWQVGQTGSAPFLPIQGGVIEVGVVGQSMAKVGQSIIWLGTKGGTTSVFVNEGFQDRRVSNFALDNWLASHDVTGAYAFTYSNNGHLFYVLTLPNSDRTWVYDVVTGKWHDRRSFDLPTDEGGVLTRHRSAVYARAFGKHLIGDYLNGDIYELDDLTYTDNQLPIVRQRTGPHVAANNERMFYSKFEVLCQVGVGLDAGVFGSDPQMQMQYSNDGGYTWSSWKYVSMGKIGEYSARVIYRMLGSGRDRVFRIRVTDPVPVRILGADLEVSGG